MFIACRPYKSGITINDKILIFDSDDLSLDYASFDDLQQLVKSEKFGFTVCDKRFLGVQVYDNCEIQKQYSHDSHCFDIIFGLGRYAIGAVTRIDASHWTFKWKNKIIHFECQFFDREHICVNNDIFYIDGSMLPELTTNRIRLHYMFIWKDYFVYRFSYTCGSCGFSVAAYPTGEVKAIWWINGEIIWGDSELAVRIDILNNY